MEPPLIISPLQDAPWTTHLRELKPLNCDATRLPTDVCWLSSVFSLSSTTPPETWRRVEEALDLLALLARVDTTTWQDELAHLWPTYAATWCAASAMAFELGLEVDISNEMMVKRLGERVVDAERPQRDYLDARKRLHGSGGEKMPSHSVRIPVRLRFNVNAHGEALAGILVQTLQIVMAQRARDAHTLVGRAQFEIVDVEFFDYNEMDHRGLRCLYKMVEYGVNVHNMPYLYMETTPIHHEHNAKSLVEIMHRLVAGTDPNCGQYHGVQKLTVSDNTESAYFLPLLSAAQVSQSLKTLLIHIVQEEAMEPGEVDQRIVDLWRCVAYTLFSPHAQHNITRIQLELNNFRAQYVDAIRAILAAWRPVSSQDLGAGVFGVLLARPSCRFLTCSKVHLFDPRDSDSQVCFNLAAPMDLRLIEIDKRADELQAVLLPGWGKGWASYNTDEAAADKMTSNFNRSFKEIEINGITQAAMPPTTTLVSMIGHDTDLLEIDDVEENAALDSWLEDMLSYLPKLTKLVINSGQIVSLDALVTTMTTTKCTVKSLVLNCDVTSVTTDQLRRFFQALADRSHRLHSSLGELRLKLPNSEIFLPVLATFVEALRGNRYLHTIRLEFNPSPSSDRRDAIRNRLLPTINAKPTCEVEPLSAAQRVAFTSVISHHGDVPLQLAPLKKLDATMLAMIFVFAGEGKARDIELIFAASP